mgnify:FL=1
MAMLLYSDSIHFLRFQRVLTGFHGFQHEMGMGTGNALDALDFPVYSLQLIGRRAGNVEQKVKVAGEVIAVGNVGVVSDGFAEVVVILRVLQTDFHKCRDVKAQFFAVYLHFIALNNAAVFHLSNAVHNGRDGQMYFLADIRRGFPGVLFQYVQNGIINLIHSVPPCDNAKIFRFCVQINILFCACKEFLLFSALYRKLFNFDSKTAQSEKKNESEKSDFRKNDRYFTKISAEKGKINDVFEKIAYIFLKIMV